MMESITWLVCGLLLAIGAHIAREILRDVLRATWEESL